MSQLLSILALLCGIFFAVSVLLFLATASKRHRLDRALQRAAARGASEPPPALGLFEGWTPETRRTLVAPERRWTYDQQYMVAFIEAARSQPIETRAGAPMTALDLYRGPIMARDMWFAAAFAAFIACAGLFGAGWLVAYPWAARTCMILACMGLVYGAADLAEDAMLCRIFGHAVTLAGIRSEESDTDWALADAAQADAANVLTRLKFVSILASVSGVVVFGVVFLLIDAIWVRLLPADAGA